MTHESLLNTLILSMVQTSNIVEQSELQQGLKERGYDIPQATLSRRLKKLNIAKVSGIYKIIDYNQPNLPLVLNMNVSESGLIVLHTSPGQASSLGYFIDKKHVSYHPQQATNSGILGTIAGDDTVLLIIQGPEYLEGVMALLNHDFPYLKTTMGIK